MLRNKTAPEFLQMREFSLFIDTVRAYTYLIYTIYTYLPANERNNIYS